MPETGEPWAVVCHDCGWEKVVRDDGMGLSPERSAKAAKAGHMGGGQRYSQKSGAEKCIDVEAEPLRLKHLLVEENDA